MNVPVTPDGGLKFDDGVSAPGCYVEMQSTRQHDGADQQLSAT